MPAAVETMAYVGETPWHGLGVKLPADPTVDQVREAAGLTWEPSLRELKYNHNGNKRTSELAKTLVRDDTGAELTVVGPKYVPIKNAEVVEFFREYVETGALTLETAGVLQGGRWVWALAATGQAVSAGKGDEVRGYVLLTNPHQYGKGATAKPTAVRVVCSNTHALALSDGEAAVRIWHVEKFDPERRARVRAELAAAHEELAIFEEQAQRLAAHKLAEEQVRTALLDLFAPRRDTTVPADAQWEEAPRVAVRVKTLYDGEGKGAKLLTASGTAWGLWNAVVQLVDWERGKTADTRLESAWYGGGAVTKRRALEQLLAGAGAPAPPKRARARRAA